MRQFLTTEEVSERYRGQISTGTLENWRTQRIGPPFVKIGRAVLYPRDELDAWNKRNLVTCANGKMEGRRRRRPSILPLAQVTRLRLFQASSSSRG